MSNGNILLCVSGSIAAFKAAALTSKLVQENYNVHVVLSQNGERFVGKATFEGLTRNAVYTDTFEDSKMMAHIDLARWADVILYYPASANLIAELAHGLASNLQSTLYLAAEKSKRILVAPAMNVQMWMHEATQKNISTLQERGVEILEPQAGHLACREEGAGRLVEPETALARISNLVSSVKKAHQTKVLVTYGGTSEPIDAVRSITNTSTGRTGKHIAEALLKAGFDVDVLKAESALSLAPQYTSKPFKTFSDLKNAFFKKLETTSYDWVIHAAAVSDFSPTKEAQNKKLSSKDNLTLHLTKNEKLLSSVRALSKNKATKIVAFKLTANENLSPDLSDYDADYILHNDLAKIDTQSNQHEITVYGANHKAITHLKTKTEISNWIVNTIMESTHASHT